MDKNDPIAPFNLDNVLVAQGKTTEAIHRFSQAIGRDPNFAESYYNRARLREARGDTGSAQRDLRLALDADPDYSHALFNLAQIELQSENADLAIDLFNRFLLLDPGPEWRAIAIKARSVAAQKSTKPARSRLEH